MRSTRNQPFCWQEKKVLRLLRNNFKGAELAKLRNLYLTITEIDSDFNNEDIKFFTKTISTYSGLSTEWIPTGLKIFEKLKMIEIIEEREKGQFKGKKIVFTPENIDELGIFTVTAKSPNGKHANGFSAPSEDILYQEDILCKKNHDNHDKELDNHDKELDVFENLFKTFGVNYTNTNQASVKTLLKTMSEKEVIDYLTETYNALKANKAIKSIVRAFSAKIQKGERQTNPEPKVKKAVETNNEPIIKLDEKNTEKKVTLGEPDLDTKDNLTLIQEAVSTHLRNKGVVGKEFLRMNNIVCKLKTEEEVKEFAKKYDIEI
ncbi:MAG: hypothetical protein RSD13_02820 [Clostridium sp.]